MKYTSCLLVLLLAPLPAWAQIKLPEKVVGNPGTFISVPATTTGKVVKWYPLDAGLNLFPTDLLKDTKTAVVVAPAAGTYRLLAWTADADGLPTDASLCTIVVGTGPPPPPPPPPNSPFPKPVVSEPTGGGKYLITIYADPPSDAFKAVAGSEATWRTLEGMGYAFRIFNAAGADPKVQKYAALGTPPFLIVLDPSITNAKNFVVVSPYPATTDALLAAAQKTVIRKR